MQDLLQKDPAWQLHFKLFVLLKISGSLEKEPEYNNGSSTQNGFHS
jgi:hypothetical protein